MGYVPEGGGGGSALPEAPALVFADQFADLSGYTVASGTGLSAAGGALTLANADTKTLLRADEITDGRLIFELRTGASGRWGAQNLCRLIDSNNFIMAHAYDNGSNSVLQLYKKDGGAFTAYGASVNGVRLGANKRGWLTLEFADAFLRLAVWKVHPELAGQPGSFNVVEHTLTGGDETKFGSAAATAKKVGLRIEPQGGFFDFTVRAHAGQQQ